ncbi:MAG TPA: histidinol-phosphate transaminase [Melioribacteraceae bacterium]|nr:histidinol-phosphate transaminase [Melioribacteraceae bacterium]
MNIEKLVRQNILKLKPYTSARSTNNKGILLDANENPFGSVVENDVRELNRYPDPNQTKLREKLSELIGINQNNLFFGVGSDEIIDLLIKIFCKPNIDNVIICEPTYGMYNVCCNINDIEIRTALLTNEFDIDVNAIMQLKDVNTKLLFLCSPNNPTGNLLNYSKIEELAKSTDIIIIIDEAYIDFADKKNSVELIKKYNNVILLRTFSKAWGLAGVRCGYCIADKIIIELLFKIKAPYSINKLTENIILNALVNVANYNKLVSLIKKEREFLIKEMSNINQIKKIYKTEANFILFKVNNPKEVYKKLAERDIIIRDRSSQINLEGCLRISVGTREQNQLFIKNLKEVL